jgi:hypothetical protein
MTRKASLVAMAAAVVTLVASPSVRALEGIQGRHAIFYPSLELVYQHDDNFFLERTNEHSADHFIAHAHFALEVPGSRQYLRLEYAPQWRDVNVSRSDYELTEDVSHFWNLDARLRGSSLFSVDIHHDFTMGVLEIASLDGGDPAGEENPPGGSELVRNDEPFWTNNIDVDFNWEGSRQGAIIGVGHHDSNFDDSEDAPAWFELNETRLGAEYFYKFTPLTKFLVGFDYRDGQRDLTSKAVLAWSPDPLNPVTSIDSTRTAVTFGFDGELGRTTTGNARLSLVSLDQDDDFVERPDFEGIALTANVTKSFSRYSKLIFGVNRSPNYSAYAVDIDSANPYYVSNRASVTFTNQPQGSRVFWTLVGAFNRNSYDEPTDSTATIPVDMSEREDDVTYLRGEVGFHPLEHLSFRLNYRYEERESNHNEFDYEDNLWIFQIQFGF